MALRGCVIALQVPMVSPEIWVGVQLSGLVPMVQNTSKRLACLVVAARVGPSLNMDRKGASRMPAPAPMFNCLRLSLYMLYPMGLLVAHARGEARRVKDGREHALQGVRLSGSFGSNGFVSASILVPAGAAEGVV